ncbi:MAG: DUF1638 domain-containing protein [Desulfobacterales bacterium]
MAHSDPINRLIACGVFKPALEYLRLDFKCPEVLTTYLPASLHLKPELLKFTLQQAVAETLRRRERPLIVYGDCFNGINEFCRQLGIAKLPGRNCYEMLLGDRMFESVLTETAGTFFVERELLVNFDAYCSEPLELNDDSLRKIYFEHYQRLLYVRQPNDPNLTAKAKKIADFLDLLLDIRDADYSHLSKQLRPFLQS